MTEKSLAYIAGFIWLHRISARLDVDSPAYRIVRGRRLQFVHEMSTATLIAAHKLIEQLSTF